MSITKLKTQELTKLIFKYLANRNDTIFILMRAKKEWMKLIGGDVYFNKLIKDGRIITKGHNGISQAISSNNLKVGYAKIVDHLKNENKISL